MAAPGPDEVTVPSNAATELLAYQGDLWRRGLRYLDTLRERADKMLEHEQAGKPPLLDFDYEMILDGRQLARPANYALLRITRVGDDCLEDCLDESKPPVMIIDPRAGHGPGIGGFKRDSEVGMALHLGHPVYFVIFFPEPVAGQTLEDVQHVLRRFVETLGERHPGKPPVLYGNCQAGWAIVLLSADCEGLVGPAVLNGSPLSYWSGESGVNPMRLAGGLLGGAWLTHLIADLGDGRFDGAHLAANFESLKPANTLWQKDYQLFADIDGQRERFLAFERWWAGFYTLSKEEITAIVENLFIGNKLERGELQICPGCTVDLKHIRNPLVIFASSGDNITPPHQALNWVPAVYPDTEALKAAGQRIIYLLNPHVGHLGIFVSAKVARLEHRAILESVGELNDLAPGLYEMKIDNPTGDPDCHKPQFQVHFEERRVEELDYPEQEPAFEQVKALSTHNVALYETFVGPWVRLFVTPWSAEALRQLHPARTSRLIFSERFAPWMGSVKWLAEIVETMPTPVDSNNPYRQWETLMSEAITSTLTLAGTSRDSVFEMVFKGLYGRRPAR
ncbi:MAG: poly(3-hydroxyalkanoate) synthetase [Halomonadaceae bacterium]|nr:poly(3-hydroxyalkanoate) synthetase [Halomonadaceae bacterium]